MAPAQYTEMRKAWHAREKRTQERFAMLALVSAKCAGNKDKSLNDFMGAFAEDDE